MSITISVGANGATTGRKDQTITGDGAIDTRQEAEEALTFLPEGSTDTVVAGKDSFTRDQLIAIRDGKASAGDGATTRGEGVSHGVAVGGNGYAGLGDPTECEVVDGEKVCGDPGHSGGGFDLSYVLGIPLGTTGLFLDPALGFRLNHGTMDYLTPGGEEANSTFTSYGATAGADLRYVLPVLDDRLWAAVGLRFGIGGFTTPDGTQVSLPSNCIPDEFGRGECEPGAGPTEGNAGTTGAYAPRVGNSRGTSGVALDLDIPITVGGDIVQGEWGSLGLAGQFIPGLTALMPEDGDGFSFWRMGGGVKVIARFGGSAARVPATEIEDKDGDGVSDADDKCPGTLANVEVDETGCEKEAPLEGVTVSGVVSSQAADAAGQQFIVKLDPPRNGTITKAEIKGTDKTYGADVDPTKLEQTGELVVTPKEKLPAGKYTFEFELDDNGVKKIGKVAFEVKDIANLDVKITPDQANAPAEKTSSPISFGITTNKKVSVAPRFVLQGATAGLQSLYYPDPKTYELDASQPGQATSFNFKTPDTLPAGKYTVIFDVTSADGTTKRVTSTIEVKKNDAKPVIEIAGSFKKGETLSGKISPSEKITDPAGMPVTYVVTGNGATSPAKQAVLKDGATDLNLTCPPALVTQGGKIYRTSKTGTYTVKVTYGNGKTVEKTFEVK